MDTSNRHINEILVIIVLYKSTLIESKSYQSIVKGFQTFTDENQRIDLMVVNNGPLSFNCQADNNIFQLHFIEQLDNPGVSKAYNIGGNLAERLGKHWLMLLDQDTYLPEDFWNYYVRSIDLYPNQPLYAPKLRAGHLLVSPCGYQLYRGYVLDDLSSGTNRTRGHNVLNSGLLVSTEAFKRVGGYDESVRLYFSDFIFFDRLKAIYDTFVVVDVNLLHDLSSSDYSSQDVAMQRFALYCQGARAAAKHEPGRLLFYFVTVCARSLVMNKRFNNFVFTKVFIKAWFGN